MDSSQFATLEQTIKDYLNSYKMYASLNWIKKYIKTNLEPSPSQLRELVTLHSFEVDSIESEHQLYENIVVGQIFSLTKHENADSLTVCQVDIGSEIVQIVCGGSNLEKDMLVAVALPKARVRWHGEGELITLQKTKIRGESSYGMICAADEIGLGTSQGHEILDLNYTKAKPGTLISELFDKKDIILDVDNKSITNRPDLWSHHGLAREIAAITGTKFEAFQKSKKVKIPEAGQQINLHLENPEIIHRFQSVIIENLEVKPSPQIVQEKLEKCGIKPINNIVDATNIVMLDLGMPMHAYDFDYLQSQGQADLTIKYADAGTQAETLDGKKVELQSNDLVICKKDTPLCLLGIMGMQNSAIKEDTKTVLLESAAFNQELIRKSFKNHNIRTESYQRHEKAVDPEQTENAIYLCIETLMLSCPDLKIAGPIQDAYPHPYPQNPISLPLAKLNSYLTLDLSAQQAQDILQKLEFQVEIQDETIIATAPSFRSTGDINIPEDLIEEIGRIYGYHNIPSVLPEIKKMPQFQNKNREFEHHLRTYLTNIGYFEALNYCFYGEHIIEAFELNLNTHIKIQNALSKEAFAMRTSMLPNLIGTLEKNKHLKQDIKFFEIGRTYTEIGQYFPAEELKLAIIQQSDSENFFEVKATIESIFERNGYKSVKYKEGKQINSYQHPYKILDVLTHDNKLLGQIFGVSPVVLQKMNIDTKSYITFATINLGMLEHLPQSLRKPSPISKFPATTFDVSVVIDKNTPYAEIANQIKKSSQLIQEVELFDNYQGANIDSDKKALAFKIKLQSLDRTLEDTDLHTAQSQIFKTLESIGGTIRGK